MARWWRNKVSILDRLTGRHLDDAALAAIWTRTGAGEAGLDPHLAACAECRVRLDAFASWMNEIASDARTEADGAFPAERLAVQQAQILRRLEAAERPARVIAFPKTPPPGAIAPVPIRRWIAAAAAAGLIVGVGLGQLMDLRHPANDVQQIATSRALPAPPVETARGVIPASTSGNDETTLLEIEAASTPQYEALRAFDTLTPRAADFLQSSR